MTHRVKSDHLIRLEKNQKKSINGENYHYLLYSISTVTDNTINVLILDLKLVENQMVNIATGLFQMYS